MKMSILALFSFRFKHAAQYYGISFLDFFFLFLIYNFPPKFFHLIFHTSFTFRFTGNGLFITLLISTESMIFVFGNLLYISHRKIFKEIKLVSRYFLLSTKFPMNHWNQLLWRHWDNFCNGIECSEENVFYILWNQ